MEECVNKEEAEVDGTKSTSCQGNEEDFVNCSAAAQYSEEELLPKESKDRLSPTSRLVTALNTQSEDSQQHAGVGDTKGFICSACGCTLSCISSLDKHMWIHDGEKPYHCAVCGQLFTTKDNMDSLKLPDGKSVIKDNIERCFISEDPESFWNTMVVAGMLFVCETCVEAQETSVHKWMVRRQNEPLHARLQRLEHERTAKRYRRANESAGEREIRRLRDREAKRLQRMHESEDQRARRLQRDREATRMKRANETPEKRQARLVREREARRIRQSLQKIDPDLSVHIS